MTTPGGNRRLTTGFASPELLAAVQSGPFEAALRFALRDYGLSLDRIEHRLRALGLNVSASSLSNWQNGRSRPERAESIEALRWLEEGLALPGDTLVRLFGPRRARGRWLRHVPGSVRYDALLDDHARLAELLAEVDTGADQRIRSVACDELVSLDAEGRFRSVAIRQLLTSREDGVANCTVFYHSEDDGPLPDVAAPPGCRIGRCRSDEAAGFTVAEFLFDHVLGRGEVMLLDYEFRFPEGAGPRADRYYRVLRNPGGSALLRVSFAPAATPVRCEGFRAGRVGTIPAEATPLPCQRGRTVHWYTPDAAPGVTGIRWEWE
ncbi:helix-turn-helix domain-containing protein [Phytomonospora endophytica]|uniref:Transcriptional regulator with XRE-family HTH domain n=1 Tax=Phytomonospora endophytica TaxID=714109 RepID=A0A841FYL1_9ACTN|nr:helix-turn-helix domain-containing protein [Phytomonospora endophytica]MBB6038808.1 transcriptional regulator with XRE-family HTH domain [Phytomonospora endophytica]GIG68396.1 hypothetical protein Pen01_46910 [Phytomonospora endophytica]